MMFVMIFFLHFFTIELVITCLSFFHRMFLIFFLVSFYFLIKVLLFYRSKLKQVFFIRLHHLRFVIALFSAGGETSLVWAPKFAEAGTTVIDNSSAWRMDPTKKLIVPEINASQVTKEDKIIANPNCSTIQMVLVLAPLHAKYKIKRVIVSTYQSITGTGVKD